MYFLRECIGSESSDHNIWSDDFQLVLIFSVGFKFFSVGFNICSEDQMKEKQHKLKEFTDQLKENRRPNERKTTQDERI